MTKYIIQFIVTLGILSGCYTVLKHPDVLYSDKLGIHPDSMILISDSHLLGVNYNDNCASCHSDYNSVSHSRVNTSGVEENNNDINIAEQFQNLPWWRSEVWSMEESDFDSEKKTSKRSRRSYNKASSDGGGSPEYLSPPGINPPANLKIKISSSSSAAENGSANTATRAKDSPEDTNSDNTDQKTKSTDRKKPKRRR